MREAEGMEARLRGVLLKAMSCDNSKVRIPLKIWKIFMYACTKNHQRGLIGSDPLNLNNARGWQTPQPLTVRILRLPFAGAEASLLSVG